MMLARPASALAAPDDGPMSVAVGGQRGRKLIFHVDDGATSVKLL
jgi:hypothetical protein